MLAGSARREIAISLKSAYSDGLLSDETFARRLDQLVAGRLVEPRRLLGDLRTRRRRSGLLGRVARLPPLARWLGPQRDPQVSLLALDWSGAQSELTIGRHFGCDIVLSNQTVSRHHACLTYREGIWVLHDLQSTNGTMVNGEPVEHCVLHPGDDLVLGDQRLTVD